MFKSSKNIQYPPILNVMLVLMHPVHFSILGDYITIYYLEKLQQYEWYSPAVISTRNPSEVRGLPAFKCAI